MQREQVGPFTHVCIDCGALGVAGGYHDHGNGSAGDTMPLAALPEMVRQMHSAERDRDDLMEQLERVENERDVAVLSLAALTPAGHREALMVAEGALAFVVEGLNEGDRQPGMGDEQAVKTYEALEAVERVLHPEDFNEGDEDT